MSTIPFDPALWAHLGLFFMLVLGIVVLPGMDMAYVMGSSLVGGRHAGAAAVAGIVTGGAVHTALGGLGIGLVLSRAPQLFNTMLLAGALYVAWMGWSIGHGARALREVDQPPAASSPPLQAIFLRAVLTCLLNPKAYVFMLAVFPQFLRADRGSVALQSLALGTITALTQLLVYGSVAIGAAGLRNWLRSRAAAQRALQRLVGAMLVIAALWSLWQGWRAL